MLERYQFAKQVLIVTEKLTAPNFQGFDLRPAKFVRVMAIDLFLFFEPGSAVRVLL